jgi:hypothetical protein
MLFWITSFLVKRANCSLNCEWTRDQLSSLYIIIILVLKFLAEVMLEKSQINRSRINMRTHFGIRYKAVKHISKFKSFNCPYLIFMWLTVERERDHNVKMWNRIRKRWDKHIWLYKTARLLLWTLIQILLKLFCMTGRRDFLTCYVKH